MQEYYVRQKLFFKQSYIILRMPFSIHKLAFFTSVLQKTERKFCERFYILTNISSVNYCHIGAQVWKHRPNR